MRLLFFFLFFFLLSACSNTNKVFWCGDHPCVNKKERKVYFKETMIVEIRNFKKGEKKNYTNLDIIKKNFIKEEKEKAKNKKILEKQEAKERKNKIKAEKEQKRLALIQKKKDEKELKMREKNDKKSEMKKKKKIIKKNSKIISAVSSENNKNISEFNDLAEAIFKKNSSKSYPDINDMPN